MAQLPNIQVFTTNGTWTKPNKASIIQVICIGGGGGGESGPRFDSAGGFGGGQCGNGGNWQQAIFNADNLNNSENIVVGAGGPGGSPVMTDNYSVDDHIVGIPGGNGGTTVFGTTVNVTSAGGQGGGNPGIPTPYGIHVGGGAGLDGDNFAAGGGGNGGANIDDGIGGKLPGDGQDGGGKAPGIFQSQVGGGSGGSASGGNGSNGASVLSGMFYGGGGGGGGGHSVTTGIGGNGGFGGLYGGGGGGGGCCWNGIPSGAGGHGASGLCVVISW